MKIKVQVTQDDINKGERCSYLHCPVARGMHRAIGTIVGITPMRARFLDDGSPKEVALPNIAADFIIAFDSERAVTPFEFEIDVPDNGPESPDTSA